VRVSSAYTRNGERPGWNNNCNNYGCHGYAISYIPSFVNLHAAQRGRHLPTPTVGPQSNPLQLTELGVNNEETNRFTGGATVGWTPFRSDAQDLRLVAGGGLDGFDQSNDVWTPNDLFFERDAGAARRVDRERRPQPVLQLEPERACTTTRLGVHGDSTSFGVQYEDRRLKTFQIRTQNLLPGQRNVNQGTQHHGERRTCRGSARSRCTRRSRCGCWTSGCC
jgi:hypothetical protein